MIVSFCWVVTAICLYLLGWKRVEDSRQTQRCVVVLAARGASDEPHHRLAVPPQCHKCPYCRDMRKEQDLVLLSPTNPLVEIVCSCKGLDLVRRSFIDQKWFRLNETLLSRIVNKTTICRRKEKV